MFFMGHSVVIQPDLSFTRAC